MNAHICRCVPNIIVMRTLETRSTCLPTTKKLSMVRRPRGHTRTPMCDRYRAKNSISVACRYLPFLAFAMLEKGGSRLPHGGECAGHAVCHDFQPADLYFLRSCQWDTFLDLFKSPTFKGTSSLPPSNVCPSVSCFTLHPLNPSSDQGQSGEPARTSPRASLDVENFFSIKIPFYIRKL